jgi:hypothetical protein
MFKNVSDCNDRGTQYAYIQDAIDLVSKALPQCWRHRPNRYCIRSDKCTESIKARFQLHVTSNVHTCGKPELPLGISSGATSSASFAIIKTFSHAN